MKKGWSLSGGSGGSKNTELLWRVSVEKREETLSARCGAKVWTDSYVVETEVQLREL